MAQSSMLGEVREVRLPQGTLRYRERGSGRPVVFIHGLLVNGDLWRKVVPGIAEHCRCIVPDLPLGAHEVPLNAEADLSIPGVARLIADFLDALELDDAVLVANDTGGALTQIVMTKHPNRVGAVVLTSCDAFENFLPALFTPLLMMARFPSVLALVARPLLLRPLQRLPIAFGWLAKRPIEAQYADGYLRPFIENPAVRADCVKVMRSVDHRYTLEAAEALPSFSRPVLLAWSREDRFFPVAHAERLAARLPDATVQPIDDCYTFSSEDNPEALTRVILEFLARHAAPAARPHVVG